MRTLRPVIIVLGLVLIAGGTAYAATPEEQAIFRAEAQALTEQTRGLEQQADTSRAQAKGSFLSSLAGADGLEDQANAREIGAYQRWLQGGAPKKAQANLLRESARALRLEAYDLGVQSGSTDFRAANARSRAAQFRAAAEALLASGADAETKAIAKDMTQQAAAEDRDGKRLESESASLLRKKASLEKRADAITVRAVELEASTP
jgi:hypothetical protein